MKSPRVDHKRVIFYVGGRRIGGLLCVGHEDKKGAIGSVLSWMRQALQACIRALSTTTRGRERLYHGKCDLSGYRSHSPGTKAFEDGNVPGNGKQGLVFLRKIRFHGQICPRKKMKGT